MNSRDFNTKLFSFLSDSPTPFHAVASISILLEKSGFIKLAENENWQIQKGRPYFIIRDDGALIAFNSGKTDPSSFRIVGAHSDSPCLQLKPQPDLHEKDYHRLGVEIYGGALLHPWFDRELSIAGRVIYRTENSILSEKCINFVNPVAVIPSLAIHLNRDANKDNPIKLQNDIIPILGLSNTKKANNFLVYLKNQLKKEHGVSPNIEILSYDLFLHDCQKPGYAGINNEFIAGSRLDNLLSCCIAAYAITAADRNNSFMFVCNNHEEIGSTTASGAQGNLLLSVFERLFPQADQRFSILSDSFFISLDNAHAVHPNFSEKSEPSHDVFLNHGPVVKLNSQQRYASTSISSAIFKQLCSEVNVPFQEFVMRNDMACGSTIGPMSSTKLGVKTVDVGIATLAMHSIRELAGAKDPCMMLNVIQHFFNRSQLPAVQN